MSQHLDFHGAARQPGQGWRHDHRAVFFQAVGGQAEAPRHRTSGLRRVVEHPRKRGQPRFERRRSVAAATAAEPDADRPVRILFDVDLRRKEIAPLLVRGRFSDLAPGELGRGDAAQPAQRSRAAAALSPGCAWAPPRSGMLAPSAPLWTRRSCCRQVARISKSPKRARRRQRSWEPGATSSRPPRSSCYPSPTSRSRRLRGSSGSVFGTDGSTFEIG